MLWKKETKLELLRIKQFWEQNILDKTSQFFPIMCFFFITVQLKLPSWQFLSSSFTSPFKAYSNVFCFSFTGQQNGTSKFEMDSVWSIQRNVNVGGAGIRSPKSDNLNFSTNKGYYSRYGGTGKGKLPPLNMIFFCTDLFGILIQT